MFQMLLEKQSVAGSSAADMLLHLWCAEERFTEIYYIN